MMITRTLCLAASLACLLALAAPVHAQDKDLVWAMSQAPADAGVVAGVRSIQELETSLKALVGPDADELALTKMFEEGTPPGALDATGPAVLVVIGGEKVHAMGLMRIKDAAKLAGQAVEGNIVKIELPPAVLPPGAPEGAPKPPARVVYVLKMEPWAVISEDLEGVKAFAAATARLSNLAQQRQDIAAHLLWVYLNPKPLAGAAKSALAEQQKAMAGAGMPAAQPNALKVIDWLVGLLDQTQSIVVKGNCKPEGVTLVVDTQMVEGSPLAGIVAATLPIESFKGGLPAADRLLVAGWLRGDWSKAMAPAKTLIKPLIDALSANSDEAARKSLDQMWSMYDQWSGVIGTDMAFQMEAAPAGQGLYRMAETFAVKDPVQYRQLMAKMMPATKDLMRILMAQMGNMPGGPQIKMESDYKENAETIEGLPIDLMHMKIDMQLPPDAPPQARAQMKSMMDAMYGPEGITMRMALVEKTAIVAMGGQEQMARAIKAARGQAPGLSADPKVTAAVARMPKGACGATVISASNYIYMTMSMMDRMMFESAPPPVKAAAQTAAVPPLVAPVVKEFTTAAATVDGRRLRLSIDLPKSDVQGAVTAAKQGAERMQWYMREMQQLQMKQQGGPAGASPQGGPAPSPAPAK